MNEGIIQGPGKSAINPDVLFNEAGKKIKAFLKPDQVYIFAATEAIQEFQNDRRKDVLLLLVNEIRENSRALDGNATMKYVEVATKRIEVDDRKRVFQKEEQTM